MARRITSVVVHLSGNIAYRDNSHGIIHAQLEWNDIRRLLWSIDEAQSRDTARQVAANINFYELLSDLDNTYTWTASGDAKPIADAVGRATITWTTSDNREYHVDATFENGRWRTIAHMLDEATAGEESRILGEFRQLLVSLGAVYAA